LRADRREPDFTRFARDVKDAPVSHDLDFRYSSRHPRVAKPIFLVNFLRYNDADTIYLVGDIIDGWRLKRSMVLAANP